MRLLETLDHYDNLFLTSIFNLDGKRKFSNLLPWISHSANGYYYPALPFILMLINPDVGLSFLITGLIAFIIELPAYKIIKHKIKRNRPYEVRENINNRIKPSDKFSLPSGHTSAACIMTIILSYIYPIASAPLAIWTLLVGISRIYLGVHYPTDIVAGVALGTLSAVSSIFITAHIL